MAKTAPKIVFLRRRARRDRHERWHAAVATLDARLVELERRFGALDRTSRAFVLGARMRTALFASVIVHLAVIFGVGFKVPAKPPLKSEQSLEVVLVNAKSQTRPVVADALAQHNLDRGGNTEQKRRAHTPLPVTPPQRSDEDMSLAQKRVDQLEREARQVVTQAQSPAKVEAPQPAKASPAAEPDKKAAPSAADIMARSLELARLEAKISRESNAYQERPRRKFIGSRTQEYRFARYVEDWRQKVERVGDLNYPQGARDQRVHGKLVVTVAIKPDGTVERVDINVPSGYRVLDDAARHIVQLAAPFAPFPPDIAKDVDILHITRTWTFTTGDRFVSE